MKKLTTNTFLTIGLAGCVLAALSPMAVAEQDKAKLGEKAPNFTLPDIDGKDRSLADYKGKTVVLVWFNPDCPFVVNVYRGGVVARTVEAMKKMGEDYVLLAIDSSANKPRAEVIDGGRKFLKKYDVEEIPLLVDYEGAVGHMYEARTTPHAFVIDAAGVLRYHGELTDDPMARKPDAVNRVLSTLEMIKAGETVSPDYIRPWGCSVKYKKTKD